MGQVIVVLDRDGAEELTSALGAGISHNSQGAADEACPACAARDRILAALDTDPEALVERVARALWNEGKSPLVAGWDESKATKGKDETRRLARAALRALSATEESK